MAAFRFFDPYAFSDDEEQAVSTERAAEPLGPEPAERDLASLAGLAGVPADNRVSARTNKELSQDATTSVGDAAQNGGQRVQAAKAAKPAKDEVDILADPASGRSPLDADHQARGEPGTESQLIAPASWFARYASQHQEEPPYDQPCPDRRGRVKREGAAFLHFCVICGAWGAFGYDVFGDRPGRWYCFEHRPSGT
jgi:hypothetical protein